ncbi:MAG: protein kinase, partial [Prosthecobacter sp.]|uniref:serine/threonine-protein kinase n=1 Tax=Prosthecobacter sp. TaxID=1965333 RepID=UPI0019EA52F6
EMLPQYQIEALIGRGGMGAVYKGMQKALERPVAIKILPPEIDDEDASFTERFKNEAKIMARLEHPAIVPVYDFGETSDGLLYFVMGFINGTDIHQMIQSQGRLPPEHALAITAHVCDALQYAHSHGVVHRDIKPSNILINMQGQVKVADFGLAKAQDSGQGHALTKTGLAMGTPDYVAPEALMMGVQTDGRADLYAVGVMLYQMLTGQVPRGAFDLPSKLSGCDPRFDKVVMQAMKYDREERYSTALDLRRDLDVILTAPLVRSGGQSSAAIPMQAAVQTPTGKPPQPRSDAGTPARTTNKGGVAATPNAAGKSAHAPLPPAKSKAPLFIGLAAAAAIGIGAFVMMGGKKGAKPSGPLSPLSGTSVPQTTKPAQGTERTTIRPAEPAKAQPRPAPAPVSSSPSLPVPASSDKFPPGKWVKVFTKAEDLPEDLRKAGVKVEDGVICFGEKQQSLKIPNSDAANFAVRARIRRGSTKDQTKIVLRENTGKPAYQIYTNSHTNLLIQKWIRIGEVTNLGNLDVSVPAPGNDYSLEFAAVGSRLIGRVGDSSLIMVNDDSLKSGNAKIYGAEDIRDIEVINLDGLSEADALKILGVDEKGNDLRQKTAAVASTPTPGTAKASTAPVSSSPSPPISKSSEKFPPGQWVKLFTKFEDLPEDLRMPDIGARFEDGWLTVPLKPNREARRVNLPSLHDGQHTNMAIRLTLKGSQSDSAKFLFSLSLRYDDMEARYQYMMRQYAASLQVAAIGLATDKLTTRPRDEIFVNHPYAAPLDLPWRLEFGLVGNRLIARVDEQLIPVVTDQRVKSGRITGHLFAPNAIRDIEVINLDGLSEAEALNILGVDEKGNDLRALAAKQEQQKAEMAKQADAMAAIPELKTLHEQFVKLTAERVTAPFEKDVAALNTSYLGGLDRKMTELKQKGDLDGVLALVAEKKLIADKQLMPAEDDDTIPATLKDLRKIYRDAHSKLEATQAANLKALTDPLGIRLKQLESTLTQANRIEHAKVVREYREGLGRAAGPPAAASVAKTATTPDPALGGPSALPKKKLPPGDDRKAAEWALDMGGVIDVMEGKVKRRIQFKADLPKRSFDLVYVSIQADRPTKPVIEFTNLSALAGLRQLSFLEINGYPVQDDDTDYLATLPELKELQIVRSPAFSGRKLALLKDAEKLERLNVGGCLALAAEGIAQISQLSDLTSVMFNDCKFADADLPPLRQLKKLTSIGFSNTPVTLAGWKELKGLPLTKAVFVSPPGQAAEWCREIATLFPSITSFDVSRREPFPVEDVSAAKAFAGLEEFILASTYTENAALAEVATFPKLTKLTLRGGGAGPAAKVTDEGIAHLAKLRTLQTLRLENLSEITEQGLIGLKQLKRLELSVSTCPKFNEAAFKKARPDVTLAK